jgi:hypothetical protein
MRAPRCGRDCGAPFGFWSSPFQFHPIPGSQPGSAIRKETPTQCTSGGCAVILMHQRPLCTGAGTALDSCTKPVYPSIYMLHRMYICWEHARFSRVSPLCVVRPAAQSPNPAPVEDGGSRDAPSPCSTTGLGQSSPVCPPVCPCPQLCPRFDRPDAAPCLGRP